MRKRKEPNKRGPKRTPTERAIDKAKLAKLHRQGYTYSEIAEALNITSPQVAYDLKQIREDYKAQQVQELDTLRAEMEMQYRDILKEIWQELDRCKKGEKIPCSLCEGSGVKSAKDGSSQPCWRCKGKGHWIKPIPVDASLMGTLLAGLKGIKDLRGADAPKKTDVRRLTLSWDDLAKGELPPPDQVEQELQRLLPRLNDPIVIDQTPVTPSNPEGVEVSNEDRPDPLRATGSRGDVSDAPSTAASTENNDAGGEPGASTADQGSDGRQAPESNSGLPYGLKEILQRVRAESGYQPPGVPGAASEGAPGDASADPGRPDPESVFQDGSGEPASQTGTDK